jgi:hypothetical protein
MKKNQEIDPVLKEELASLRTVPERDPRAAARGRARYLVQAGEMLPVSPASSRRRTGWKQKSRKESYAMNIAFAVILALALVFGGGAATVQASQDDLPDQALYPVKLAVEDIRLLFNTDPETEIDMLMEMVQTRIEEMNMLAAEGTPPTEPVLNRLQSQIHSALQVAAGMDAAQGQTVLLRIQTSLQTQQQAMLQGEGESAQVMEQTRLMLQEQLKLVDQGLTDPQAFQEMFQNGEDAGQGGTDAGNGPNEEPGTGEPQDGPGTPGGPATTPGGQGGSGGNKP